MTAEENVAAVRDFVERAWNSGDETVFEEHLAPDFAHPGGRDAFKAMVLGFRSAFPDFHLEVHDMFGVGEKVVTRFTMSGTHEGEFMGIAPTGRRRRVRRDRDRRDARRRSGRRVGAAGQTRPAHAARGRRATVG